MSEAIPKRREMLHQDAEFPVAIFMVYSGARQETQLRILAPGMEGRQRIARSEDGLIKLKELKGGLSCLRVQW